MIKSKGAKDKARVTFSVDPRVGAHAAALSGSGTAGPPTPTSATASVGEDSVVDLTALAEAVPSAARRTPAKKAPPAQTAGKAAAPAARRAGRPPK